jgi:release factor glutamine methyltransferase
MLPTPSTSHVPYARVYEPAEDSFLLLDTLSSASETAFLSTHFSPPAGTITTTSPSPLVVELGPGSGVVLAFVTAHARTIFGRGDVLTLGVDVNWFACVATGETVRGAVREAKAEAEEAGQQDGEAARKGPGTGSFLAAAQGDLAGPLRGGQVDVLVFNPPYVPTDTLPSVPTTAVDAATTESSRRGRTTYEEDSALLALSYAGGRDGMEVTDRVIAALPAVLSERGVAYLLLCAQNRPEEVKERIRGLEGGRAQGRWRAETAGTSGKQAGWEKLQIVRIWRE